MTANPGAFGTLMEWREIYAIIDALENGGTPPAMVSKFQEWRDLGAAIAALVGSSSGQLPPGSTAADANEALADPDFGSTVILPAGDFELDEVLWIKRSNVTLREHASGTRIIQRGDINDGLGTSHSIRVGLDGTRLANVEIGPFTIEHDRVTSPDMRSLTIDLDHPCDALWIHDIDGVNLTSDFFTGRPYPWNEISCDGLLIHDIDIEGIWEGVVNFHAAHFRNIRGWNIHARASNQHAGYQGPMLFELNIEQTVGSVVNAQFSDSSLTLTGAAYQAAATLGIVHNSNSARGACWYDQISYRNVTINGAQYGAYHPAPNQTYGVLPAQRTLVTHTDCHFLNCTTPYYVYPYSFEATAAKIVSNRCVPGGGNYSAHAWDEEFAEDQEIYAKVTNITDFMLQIGMPTPNDSANGAQYYVYFTSPILAAIHVRYDPGYGIQDDLMGATFAITHSADDEWKLRRTVSAGVATITVYKNDALQATRTDSDNLLAGPGYVGFTLIDPTTSINDVGGGAVGSSALLDDFNRTDEDPLDPANWVANGGSRTGSTNDRIVFIRCTGNTDVPVEDQSRLGANGEINVDEIDNDWAA